MLVFVWINELYNVNTNENENYYKLKNYLLSMLLLLLCIIVYR